VTEVDFRQQPHNEMAEKIVLGAMLESSVGASKALAVLVSTDLYVPAHGLIFDTVLELYAEREPTGVGVVHNRLLRTGRLARIPGGAPYLLELVRAGEAKSVEYYAREVADLALVRAIVTAGKRIVQRGLAQEGCSGQDLLSWAGQALAEARAGTGVSIEEDDRLLAKDLSGEPAPFQWVIPRLMERRDRLVLTGDEGGGKSTLIRQLAVCAAAGLDPFDPEGPRYEPRRVLVVDCENSYVLSQRRYRPLIRAAEEIAGSLDDRLCVYLRPRGLDLTRRPDSGWLLRRVEDVRPDLITVGPVYRLHQGDPSEESDARRVSVALDSLREVCDSALIVEGHAPHGSGVGRRSMRPVGSSLWLRWPEMGLGLTLDRKDPNHWMFRPTWLEPWRGSRETRAWPKRIRASRDPASWPWVDDGAT
jgi:AAA domain/DnaB-like helicase N terminal domain